MAVIERAAMVLQCDGCGYCGPPEIDRSPAIARAVDLGFVVKPRFEVVYRNPKKLKSALCAVCAPNDGDKNG